MPGQKQSFRFRLPWLPSLAAAPTRPSSPQRQRKNAQPPLPPAAPVRVIPIQRQILQPTGDSPPTHPPAEPPKSESKTPLPGTESQPLPPGAELAQSVARTELQLTGTIPPQLQQQQQPLAQAARLPSRTNSETPSERLEAMPQQELTKPMSPSMGAESSQSQSHVPLSGMDANPPQFSSISSAPTQATPKTESPPPPEPVSQSPSPRRLGETKPPSTSYGSILTQKESQSSLPSQKTSPTLPKSQPRSPPHTGTPTLLPNSQPPSSTRPVTAKRSNSGSPARSTAKQPSSPFRAVTHPGTSSPPPVPYSRADKSSPKAPSHSTLANDHQISSPKQSPSPPLTNPTPSPSSAYSTGESSVLSKVQPTSGPNGSQHVENLTTQLQEVEADKPDAIKGNYSEAIEANEHHTPIFINEKMTEPEPSPALETKQVIATKFMEHSSTEEGTDTEETDEDESHWSGINKGKQKLYTKPEASSEESGGDIPMLHDSETGEGQRSKALHKEMKHDVLEFIHKLSLGKLGGLSGNIITISGENRGATLHLGRAASSSLSWDGKAVNNMASKKSDPETISERKYISGGRKHKDASTDQCVNSNVQIINNSMLLDSCVSERNPGVHIGTLGNNSLLTGKLNKSRKDASSSSEASTSHKTQMKVTTAGKQPVIRRRCLRGLLMESSDSEPDNPEKPRRHGCRYTCGKPWTHDF
uniref:Uncharacterized protein n=1 Tax=Kalanchoe fedtschenkoi TaxID=63787 RepID=A0A7N0UNJ3_KALFE